jgi:hypothetical protein
MIHKPNGELRRELQKLIFCAPYYLVISTLAHALDLEERATQNYMSVYNSGFLHPSPIRIRLRNSPRSNALIMPCFFGVKGGYLAETSPPMLLARTDLRWLNESNEAFPWYAPVPLSPTPPKGKSGKINKNTQFYFFK